MELLPTILQWILTNFGLFMLMLSLVFISINRSIHNALHYEMIYKWLALFPLGMTAIYACIMHAFFPVFTAASIGWQDSPFQFEVAIANLAIGVIAILSAYQNSGFRLATVIASACWLWGDAIGHLHQLVSHHNVAVGNAGSWFYMDILIPLLLIRCIIRMRQPNFKIE